jgi:NAD(P)H dehydrogenase (quinone)
MRILIVLAHAEPTSFNHALTDAAASSLRRAGHEVVVSDLYAMRFDPVSDRRNFSTVKDPSRFAQQVEEAHASRGGGFVKELEEEMDKVAWCSALILQFPLWWLGMPAIMKGWIDRVFAIGRAYGGGRWFDTGMMAQKRAMCSVTIGGREAAYSEQGAYGSLGDVLHPIHRGILGFVGFTVVEPFTVFAPGRKTNEERHAELRRFAARALTIEDAPCVAQPRSANYDRDLVRVRTLPSH